MIVKQTANLNGFTVRNAGPIRDSDASGTATCGNTARLEPEGNRSRSNSSRYVVDRGKKQTTSGSGRQKIQHHSGEMKSVYRIGGWTSRTCYIHAS